MRRRITKEMTQANRTRVSETHMHCPMEVRQKGPHIGLYCACHGAWIKWISQKQADHIKDYL